MLDTRSYEIFSPRASSTKTRIETITSYSYVNFDGYLRGRVPQKQGLKLNDSGTFSVRWFPSEGEFHKNKD